MDAATYCERYMEKVFYFCLRKTGSERDAEELASEIGCEVLSALERGVQPRSEQAWVWRIARNRWARWVVKRRGMPVSAMEDIGELPSAEDDVEQSAIAADELNRLRRGLAFIRSEYRTLLVAHYFEGKSVATVARDMNLPVGTVKTRLLKSRRELKEGMEMAREFGKRSFAPENVDFVNCCSRFGDNGQPWTILEHLLYTNIFLEVYGTPQTAEELSLELGVALPYMESELEYLTRQTFLTREGNRYQTAFPIVSREARERIAARYREVTPELTGLLTAELDAYGAACERIGQPVQGAYQSWEDAKWALLMYAVDVHVWVVDGLQERQYTPRPDNGAWDIIGLQATDTDLPRPVGKHSGYLVAQEGLPYVNFNAYRFNFRDIRLRTKDFYDHQEIAALKRVCEGKKCEQDMLDRLASYGLIRQEGSKYAPNVLVLREKNRRMEKFTAEERDAVHDLARRIEALLRELNSFAEQVVKEDLPESFRADPRLPGIINEQMGNDRGYVLEQAFRDGWLRDDAHTSRTIGMWLTL